VFHIEKMLPLSEELSLTLSHHEARAFRVLVVDFPANDEASEEKLRKAAVAHHLQMLNDSEQPTT
jgi:hypothetical protein